MDEEELVLSFQVEGVKMVMGRLKGQTTMTVQSIIFSKDQWTEAKAKDWLGEHKFKSSKIDETENSFRFRQRDPSEFEEGSFRTITPGNSKKSSEEDESEEFARKRHPSGSPRGGRFAPKGGGGAGGGKGAGGGGVGHERGPALEKANEGLPSNLKKVANEQGYMATSDRMFEKTLDHPKFGTVTIKDGNRGFPPPSASKRFEASGFVSDKGGVTRSIRVGGRSWGAALTKFDRKAKRASSSTSKSSSDGDDWLEYSEGALAVWMTGESSFHIHRFDTEAAFTTPPDGVPSGHRHPIERDDRGRVTGFGETEGHRHALPDWVLQQPDGVRTLSDETMTHLINAGVEPEQATFEVFESLFASASDEDDKDDKDKKGDKDDKDEERYDLTGIEIFKVGEWNGDKYSQADLDEMVTNFAKVGFQPPIKLGHKERSGSPAFGWVSKLKRVGNKLIADFKDLPKKVYEAIKDRRFDSVSSEIFWDLERNGKKFRRVLKAVALLGSEIPAVDLAPLRAAFNSVPEAGFGRVTVHSLTKDEFEMDKIEELTGRVEDLTRKLSAAEAEVASLKAAEDDDGETKKKLQEKETETADLTQQLKETKAALAAAEKASKEEVAALRQEVGDLKKFQAETVERDRQRMITEKVEACTVPAFRGHLRGLYEIATTSEKTVKFTQDDKTVEVSAAEAVDNLVAAINSQASKLFRELSSSGHTSREEGSDYADPMAEVDKLAKKHMKDSGEKSYTTAVQHVLDENDELRQAYAAN